MLDFLDHICVKSCCACGTGVTCLDNFLTGTPANVAHLLGEPRFRLIKCDVTDFVHVSGPVDLVLHLASAASPADYLRLSIETLKVGSLGTLHALGLSGEKECRGSCWLRPARSTATRSNIRSLKATGATSTRSGRAACTTRPSATPKR